MKVAVIDIGSNSVRLMLWADGTTLYKKVQTTRLGESVALTGRLLPEAIERSALAVKAFYELALLEGAEKIFAFATAAVRSAVNGGDFCTRVKTLTGIEVDVVSGETEAKLGMLGALSGEEGGIIDIGGASTELCCEQTGLFVSLDVGAVRLYDLCGDRKDKLLPVIREKISCLCGRSAKGEFFAIGGTATTLASVKLGLEEYDADKIHGTEITYAEVSALSSLFFTRTKEEREKIAGMDVRRADVISGATYLLEQIMQTLSLERVIVSERDNMEGYLIWRGI